MRSQYVKRVKRVVRGSPSGSTRDLTALMGLTAPIIKTAGAKKAMRLLYAVWKRPGK